MTPLPRSTLHPACCPTTTQTVRAVAGHGCQCCGCPSLHCACCRPLPLNVCQRLRRGRVHPRRGGRSCCCVQPGHFTCVLGARGSVRALAIVLPSVMQAWRITPSCCARTVCAARWWSRKTFCRPKSWLVRTRGQWKCLQGCMCLFVLCCLQAWHGAGACQCHCEATPAAGCCLAAVRAVGVCGCVCP